MYKKCGDCGVTEEEAILIAYPFTTQYKGRKTDHECVGNGDHVICLSCLKEVTVWDNNENGV